MNFADAIDLVYGGLDQLGPGSDADTLAMLAWLPGPIEGEVVDAGCGTGRQTLALARALARTVHAIDNHAPFLTRLEARAAEAGLASRIRTHCMDMAEIPKRFGDIGLLWSEGAAYSIGFDQALGLWRPALRPGGLLVATELSWLTPTPPAAAREFWGAAYPAMRDVEGNCAAAQSAGYAVLATRTLAPEAWTKGYFEALEPRVRGLLDHEDETVRALASENVSEIELFRRAGDSYGYVFYALRRP
jgi:SAM-dependent methyltransferase